MKTLAAIILAIIAAPFLCAVVFGVMAWRHWMDESGEGEGN